MRLHILLAYLAGLAVICAPGCNGGPKKDNRTTDSGTGGSVASAGGAATHSGPVVTVLGDSIGAGLLANTTMGGDIDDDSLVKLYQVASDLFQGGGAVEAADTSAVQSAFGHPELSAFSGAFTDAVAQQIAADASIAVKPVNLSVSGAKIDDAASQISAIASNTAPDAIVFEFGANDFCSTTSVSGFASQYEAELTALTAAYPQVPVLIVPIPAVPEIFNATADAATAFSVDGAHVSTLVGLSPPIAGTFAPTCGQLRQALATCASGAADPSRLVALNSEIVRITKEKSAQYPVYLGKGLLKSGLLGGDILAVDCFHPDADGQDVISKAVNSTEFNTAADLHFKQQTIPTVTSTVNAVADFSGYTDTPPSVPTGLAVGSATSSTLTLTWSDSSTVAAGYFVQRSTDGTSGWADVGFAYSKSFTDTGLSPTTKYYYRVRTMNSAGESDNSDSASGTTLDIAAINLSGLPSSFSASTSLNVSLASTSDTSYYKYKIFSGSSNSCASSSGYSAETAIAASITDSVGSLSDGPVTLCVIAGNAGHTYQSYAMATSSTWTKDTVGPSTPATLAVVAESSLALDASWSASSGSPAGYVLVRRQGSAVNWTPTAGVSYAAGQDLGNGQVVAYVGSSLGASDGALTKDTTYYYSVFAFDSAYNYSDPATSSATARAWVQQAYVKPPGASNLFGNATAISGDTVVVATEDGSVRGSIYVYRRSGTTWTQEAFIQAANAADNMSYGRSVAISGDTIVVGAYGEASNQTTITNGPTASSNTSAAYAGAAYVYTRSGTTWTQQAYLKAPNAAAQAHFGYSVTIDGDTIAVGAPDEASNQTTITNGPTASSNTSVTDAGAVYVFTRSGTTWSQEAYLKAPVAHVGNQFGSAVALKSDTLVVGEASESSNQSTIINGTGASSDASLSQAGAAFIFTRSGTIWSQQAYLKAPNPGMQDFFGNNVAIDGDTVAIAANGEDSGQTTITNGSSVTENNSALDSGAIYVFKRTGVAWAQEAYLKSPGGQYTGLGLSLSLSGDTIVAGAPDTFGLTSGAGYIFKRSGSTWSLDSSVVPINADNGDAFGSGAAIDGSTITFGSRFERSNQTTITNGPTASSDNSAFQRGAAYIYVQ